MPKHLSTTAETAATVEPPAYSSGQWLTGAYDHTRNSASPRYVIASPSSASGAVDKRVRDSLTGLPTRTTLVEYMVEALERWKRSPNANRYALVFVDLNRFKSVNDGHGLLVGDHVLLEIGSRIRNVVRESDAVAHASHLDRDEFAILLEQIRSVDDVRRIVQRILDAIREPIAFSDDVRLVVSASAGIALPSPNHTSPEYVLYEAETAMRRAKLTPDDPCQVFDLDLSERIRSRLRLEAELRSAIDQGQLVLHYQPIVSARTGLVQSCEALVRWLHPTRGCLQPAEFIGIAEEGGLIVPLGRHILDLACRQIRAWQDMGFRDVTVAVNVSPRQLSNGHLSRTVAQALSNTAIDPRRLKLEITESAAATHPDVALTNLTALQRIGVELLLDDFGTGYSSLSRLTQFPFHRLKIDRSFVVQVPHSAHDCAVVSTIVTMAHRLGLGVIAEGVETVEQAEFLSMAGCDEMQGFLFSPAVAAPELERMLREGAPLLVEGEPRTRRCCT